MGGPGCEERAPPFAPTAKGGGVESLSLSLSLSSQEKQLKTNDFVVFEGQFSLSLSLFLPLLSLARNDLSKEGNDDEKRSKRGGEKGKREEEEKKKA